MWVPFALALLLLGVIHQAVGSRQKPPSDPSCHDASVSAFSAAFYTAVVFSNDPDTIFGPELSTDDASSLFYKVVLEEMKRFSICNAVIVAKTSAKGVAFLPVFNLPVYFLFQGITIGEYLKEQGILNCDNAVQLAYEFFILVQNNLDGLTKISIESYLYAIISGIIQWCQQLGLDLPQAAHDLTFIFYHVFKEGK